jgi:DNA modification methylase
MGWNDYRYKHEWILKAKKGEARKAEAMIYGWKDGESHKFNGENEFDVWDMPRKSVLNYIHPTEKPDWLAMRAIRNSTDRGEIVVDCFAGSGSTMAAAEKTGRRAFMIEMDPKFCDRIRKRWEKLKNLSNKINSQNET